LPKMNSVVFVSFPWGKLLSVSHYSICTKSPLVLLDASIAM